MSGGAYGAHAYTDALEKVFSFSTYRDPGPLASLRALPSILENEARMRLDPDTLEKTLIGAYSRIKQPQTGAERGVADFFRFLSNIDDGLREANLRRILGLSAEDIAGAAGAVHDRLKAIGGGEGGVLPQSVLIAGDRAAKEAAAALGVSVTRLPV